MDSRVKFDVINILKSEEDAQDPKPLNQGKTFYSTCMDTGAIETAGLKPILDVIEKYGSLPLLNPGWDSTKFRLSIIVGELLRDFQLDPIVFSFVATNLLHARENIIYLDGPGFLLPPEFLAFGEKYPKIISAHQTYFVSSFAVLAKAKGVAVTKERLEKEFQNVFELEKLLALAYLEHLIVQEDKIETHTLAEFVKSLEPITNGADPRTKMDWTVILEEQFKNSGVKIQQNDKIYTPVKAYLAKIMHIGQAAKPENLANYIMWRLVASVAPYTTETMVELTFNFTQAITGVNKRPPRENACARITLDNLGFAVSVVYVREHGANKTKPEVDTMIEHLRRAFIQQLNEAAWLSDSTRRKAIEKAEAVVKNIAYPDWFDNNTEIERQYLGLEVTPKSFFQNFLNTLAWVANDNLKQLRLPAGRNEWLIHPAVVNAVYDETKNSITFPAGILQPPLFISKGLMSLNYGGIGVIMGHEITHGFDTRGSYFDAEGNLQNWWEEDDRKEFDIKADCFRTQYSNFSTPVGKVNGNQTVGENIADNGGLNEAFRAYQNWIHQTRDGELEERLFGVPTFSFSFWDTVRCGVDPANPLSYG